MLRPLVDVGRHRVRTFTESKLPELVFNDFQAFAGNDHSQLTVI